MAKFRKKPIVIEAWPFSPFSERGHTPKPDWLIDAIEIGTVYFQGGAEPYYTIETLEGVMRASLGDWIIRGVKGELYPRRDDIFQATYEAVE